MGVEIESLFISALGLHAPRRVDKVGLSTPLRRIDFNLTCEAKNLPCPGCGAVYQGIHDRNKCEWRHLVYFQYESWLHAEVPRVGCSACGKTSQVEVPWTRKGSGYIALFEALAVLMCHELPVCQVAASLRCSDKQLWRRVEHFVGAARKLVDMSGVKLVGIDDTNLRKEINYITVVHDLDLKRQLFAREGRDHKTVLDFAQGPKGHAGDLAQIKDVFQEMSTAYEKGVGMALPQALISFHRFYVIAMANEAMDEVSRQETNDRPQAIKEIMGDNDLKLLRSLTWGMRKNSKDWSKRQFNVMHWLQHSTLQSNRAWRLKMALRAVYASATQVNYKGRAQSDLLDEISWARRSRFGPIKKLVKTLKERLDGVVRGMLDNRRNAYVEATTATGHASNMWVHNSLALHLYSVSHLRMSKLKHLPSNPLQPALPQGNALVHRCI